MQRMQLQPMQLMQLSALGVYRRGAAMSNL